MSRGLVPGATRDLSQGEKVLVLRNQILFLEDEIEEMERRISLLVDDNAEMDFLSAVNEHARTPEAEDTYRANVSRIDDLRGRILRSGEDIRLYRRVLADRFGIPDES